MTASGPRDGSAADEFVRESFRDIKRTLEIIQKQLQYLPQHYVSRAEFDRHRDELIVDLAGGQKQHDKDINSVQTEIRDLRIDLKGNEDHLAALAEKMRSDEEARRQRGEERAKEARTQRTALIAIALATVVGLPGSFWALYLLFHH